MPTKSFGSYSARTSFMHRLDPRTKVIVGAVFSLSIFWVLSTTQLMLSALFVALCLIASKSRVIDLILSLLPAAVLLLILGIINLLFTTDGNVIFSIGALKIYDAGLMVATLFPARVLGVLALTSSLLSTTTPTDLTDAIDRLFAPLTKLGLPAHEIAFIFALMLRFIPILGNDYAALKDSFAARAARLGTGSIKRRLSSLTALLVALIGSAIRHAAGLQKALDARAYRPGKARTHLKSLTFGANDAAAFAALILYCVALAICA